MVSLSVSYLESPGFKPRISYPDQGGQISGCPQSFHKNSGIVPQIFPWQLPCLFHIYFSLSFCRVGHWAETARGSDGPIHKGLSDRVGGTTELGCNPPRRRTLKNQTKGRRCSGSCSESKSYKGVNPDQKTSPFRLRVLRQANPTAN